LHQHQKPGFLRLLQPESLDYSLINPVFQVLLRKVQDVSLATLNIFFGIAQQDAIAPLLKV
jgi:hypothetical protein